jgi:hypothetical protein
LRLIALQLESWKKLHDLITYGLDKAKPIISFEQERQFTEVRVNLLQETEHVLRELNLLGDLSGRAMNALNRGSSLRGLRELSNEDARRLETEWNSVFTKLGVAQGAIKIAPKSLCRSDAFPGVHEPNVQATSGRVKICPGSSVAPNRGINFSERVRCLACPNGP